MSNQNGISANNPFNNASFLSFVLNRKGLQAFQSAATRSTPLIPSAMTQTKKLDVVDMSRFLSAYADGLNKSDFSAQGDILAGTVKGMDEAAEGNHNGRLDLAEIELNKDQLSKWLIEIGAEKNREEGATVTDEVLSKALDNIRDSIRQPEIKAKEAFEQLRQSQADLTTAIAEYKKTATDLDAAKKAETVDEKKITELSLKLQGLRPLEELEEELKVIIDKITPENQKLDETKNSVNNELAKLALTVKTKKKDFNYTQIFQLRHSPGNDQLDPDRKDFEEYFEVAQESGLSRSVYQLLSPKELEAEFTAGNLKPDKNAAFLGYLSEEFNNVKTSERINEPTYSRLINAYNAGLGQDKVNLPIYIDKASQVSEAQVLTSTPKQYMTSNSHFELNYVYPISNEKYDGYLTWTLLGNDEKISKTDIERLVKKHDTLERPEASSESRRKSDKELTQEKP